MSSPLAQAVAAYVERHPARDGIWRTAVEALSFMRADRGAAPVHQVHKPSLCIVLQGAKQTMLGDGIFNFGAMQYLAVGVELPVAGRVTAASAAEPYLAAVLDLDVDLLAEVAGRLAERPKLVGPPGLGLFVGDLTPQMADCLLRLTAAADAPEAVPILYPAIARELYYWLLTGPHGAAILALALPGGPARRIADAIHLIRAEFARPLPVERLAAAARMSASSFHHHFKAVTSMTPLQFQKQLRLLEARRLMLSDAANAAYAAYQVGYESASQFSREYARAFGAPPKRDAAGLRAAAG
jgi:AraC-like DNA-binding protein